MLWPASRTSRACTWRKQAFFSGPDEIAAVADYVIGAIKGKGDPGLADCVAFFGRRVEGL